MTDKIDLISDPSVTRGILQKHGFTFKKSLGQNFLTNPTLLKQMVSAAELGPQDQVLEIGPGIGALTQLLAQQAKKVLALEIDQRLLPILAETLQPYDNVQVLHQDILKADLPSLLQTHLDPQKPIKVLANLPYYITTPILLKLIESADLLDQIIVMTQYEVGERIIAQPGHKAYGSLTLAVQMNMDAEIAFKVPKSAFIPAPKVDSAIVRLRHLSQQRVPEAEKKAFNQFVLISFRQRRKRLLNNLLNYFGRTPEIKSGLIAIMNDCGLSVDVRAEALSLDQFLTLFQTLLKNGYKIT